MNRTSATLALLSFLTAAPALAGQCPSGDVLAQSREIENAANIGIKRPILAAVSLKGWRGLGDMSLRMRQLTVLPSGIIPTHWRDDRSSIVHVLSGEIWKYSNWCAVPMLRKAGE